MQLRLTLGELRNVGLEQASGRWIIQWDDDDRHHPQRITEQMRWAVPVRPVTLRRQVRFNGVSGKAVVHERRGAWGIEGTILHERTDVRYPAASKGEAPPFLKSLNRPIVADCDPLLYLRLHYGRNTWDEAHIMGPGPGFEPFDPSLIRAVFTELEHA